ncbi:MAG: hypothetical protein JRI45_06780 [Deltaproteobacteria bacterium]|nr:hypothetical protein [Deltaproteobacteria bacterium]
MARVEALLCHVIDNDLKHLWLALKILIGIGVSIFLAMAGILATLLIKLSEVN